MYQNSVCTLSLRLRDEQKMYFLPLRIIFKHNISTIIVTRIENLCE